MHPHTIKLMETNSNDTEAKQPASAGCISRIVLPSDYDAGLLNDYGGGDVEWWQDYLRAELGRANDYWREVYARKNLELMLAENANARMKTGLLALRERIRNSQDQTTGLMKMGMIVEVSLENS